MNIKELKEKFENENINSFSYNFEYEYLREGYFLLKDDLGWEVFYQERGEKSKHRWFELESDACEYLGYLVFSGELVNKGQNAASWSEFKETGCYVAS